MKTRLPIHDLIDERIPRHIGVHDDDALHLCWLAQQLPQNAVVVEIGSFKGRSTAFIASGLKSGQIYCIDVWSNVMDLIAHADNMKLLGYHNMVTQIRGLSKEVAKSWSKTWNKPIDMLFIDGNHNYPNVKQDYELWSPYVKTGGINAIHDYGALAWPGVRKFVDQCKELEKISVVQVTWSGRK